MATSEVLRYLRQKDSAGLSGPITWLGSEQRFVGGLRNSKVNNLEEQYVLGTDTYTITYKDSDGNDVIEKNFCITGLNLEGITDYYKLVTTIYNESSIHNEDYYFNQDVLTFSNIANDVAFGDGISYPNIDSIYFLNNDTFKFENNSILNIYPTTFSVIQKDELFYIQSNGNELPVLIKTTGIRYDALGRKITREHIDNLLNP